MRAPGGLVAPVDHVAPKAGRPLDLSRDAALRKAALELVAEVGYDRLTIDAVAGRARASKATVYRRWSSKAELLVAAFVADTFDGLVVPDTGSLRDDLITLAQLFWVSNGPVPRAKVLAGMMSAMLASPELRETFQAAARPPQEVVSEVIQRAVGRGEIPEPEDLETIGAILPSMAMFRFVITGAAPEPRFFAAVVDNVVIPALKASGPARNRSGPANHSNRDRLTPSRRGPR